MKKAAWACIVVASIYIVIFLPVKVSIIGYYASEIPFIAAGAAIAMALLYVALKLFKLVEAQDKRKNEQALKDNYQIKP